MKKRRKINIISMKKRLDVLVFEKGLAGSREKAKVLIMEGLVYVDNQKSDKPGMSYSEDCDIEVRDNRPRYVSRGGLKIEKAIRCFDINLSGLNSMDVGASTGGFTDCMLQNGCEKVYAIDVGYGQLDWKLRNNPKVVNLERTNVRYLDKSLINDKIDFFSVDVSFISLCLVLPVIREVIAPNALGVCLVKPQFEAGREKVGKKGVVREKSVHIEVLEKICGFCAQNGFLVLGLDYSPIKGPEGNIEYLLFVKKSDDIYASGFMGIKSAEVENAIKNAVESSHKNL